MNWRNCRVAVQFFLGFSFFFLLILPREALAQTLSTHVLAVVNGSVITEDDVNYLTRQRLKLGTVKDSIAKTKEGALEDLIAMRLIEQAVGEDAAFHKNRNLHNELDLARLEMLMKIFLDEKISSQPPATADKIANFIQGHPQFFGDRRIYYFTRIDIDKKKQLDLVAVKTFVQSAKRQYDEARNAEEKQKAFARLVGYVRSVAVDLWYTKGWKTSEEIEPQIFARLQQMQPGEVLVDEESIPGKILVLMLQSSQPVPIDSDQANQVAAQMIRYEENRQLASQLLQRLRAQADIKYGKDAERIGAKQIRSISKLKQDAGSSSHFFKQFRWRHLWAAWVFALAILVPASLVSFHRRNAAERQNAYYVDEDTLSALINRLRMITLSPQFGFIFDAFLLVFFGAGALTIIRGLSLSAYPLILVTMALTGLLAGVAIWTIWSKYVGFLPPFLSKSRWAAIVLLLLVQMAGVLFVAVG